MIAPGTQIGNLRVDRIIGRGGMGVVAVATHVQLGQRVAIKVAHDELAADPAYVARFVREARACASLRSEHACKVHDVGQLPSGAPYIVMELLEGTDLAAAIAHRPLTIAVAADYVLQACIALAEAHALGIVHRDLKPSNLFLAPRLDGTPLVKVLDFGIAKAPSAHDLALTSTAAILGSPRYMSPEQLRSARDVDARTDIWALGAILYELVSGRVPFPATSLTEAVMKAGMDPPDPLDADPAYVRVVLRCLEKPVERRYPDVAALAADLAPFAPAGAAHAALIAKLLHPAPTAAPAPPPIDPLAATASTERTADTTLQGASGAIPTQAHPRRRWLGVAGAGAVLAAGAIALAVRGGTHAAAPPDAPITVAVLPAADATVPADAAVLADAAVVVIVPPDASPVVDPAVALRTALRAAASRHDWLAAYNAGRQLSRLGQLTHADDEVYAAATDSYVWSQSHLVFDAAKADDCTTATAEAERIAGIKWNTELARAAVNCDVRVGRAAYASGEYARAFALAKAGLKLLANDQEALRLAASASCQLDDPSAPDYARRVHSDRDPATKSCAF